MAERRVFGHVPGVPVGRVFPDRQSLSDARVHGPTMAGIWGTPSEGASSIVMSGGYEDDIDQGDLIVYTGHGGNDAATKRQVADQELTAGNLALAKSCVEGLPVRVTRGARLDSPYAPPSGYRYDGLYRVEAYWAEKGRSGFRIWRFRLVREPDGADVPRHQGTAPKTSTVTNGPAPRAEATVQRIVRNTQVAQRVKELHDHSCQVCGVRLETPAGPYSEGAHIRPLGRPHDGPDHESNVLCLCPNHHALFDYGGLTIDPGTLAVAASDVAPGTKLRMHPAHPVNLAHLAYHRAMFAAS